MKILSETKYSGGFGGFASEKLRGGCSTERESVASNTIDYLASQLLSLDDNFKINGPLLQNRRPANLNIYFGNYDAHLLLSNMQSNVAASQGSACSCGLEELS